MWKPLIGLIAVACLPWLGACNTAEGVGEDVQAAGEAMSETAAEVKEDISGDDEEE